MLYNFHCHTKRCNHAKGEDRQYIEASITAGIQTLGFSDHAPYAFPDGIYPSAHRMKTDEVFEYAEAIRSLKKEYENDIRILCGFELEFYPEYHRAEMEFLHPVHPDFLILGQHFIGQEKALRATIRQSEDSVLTEYVSQVLEGLATGDFLYLAHPDIAGYRYTDEVIEREYRRLCEGAKRLHIPLEYNLLGVREGRHYPDKRFFRIAKEVGNDIVIGGDNHSPDSILTPRPEAFALQELKSLGIVPITKPLL